MSHGISFNSIANPVLDATATSLSGSSSLVFNSAVRQIAHEAFTNAITQQFGPSGTLASDAFNASFTGDTASLSGWNDSALPQATSDVIAAANHQGPNGAYTGDADRFRSDLQDAMTKDINSIINNESLMRALKGGSDKDSDGLGESWLVAIAKAMGKMLGQQAQHLVDLTNQMSQHTGKDDAQVFQQLNAEFSAQSQMFGILSNSFSNSIKTIGDGLTTLARKN
ncbi:hypothetical protein ISN75_20775 [Dyella marensis]|uniref:hypothetical protein n=1 Tax=Dyella marensis TaxID=500610 RepID=UPI0031D58A1F